MNSSESGWTSTMSTSRAGSRCNTFRSYRTPHWYMTGGGSRRRRFRLRRGWSTWLVAAGLVSGAAATAAAARGLTSRLVPPPSLHFSPAPLAPRTPRVRRSIVGHWRGTGRCRWLGGWRVVKEAREGASGQSSTSQSSPRSSLAAEKPLLVRHRLYHTEQKETNTMPSIIVAIKSRQQHRPPVRNGATTGSTQTKQEKERKARGGGYSIRTRK